MSRTSRRRAAWVVAAWLTAIGVTRAQEPARLPATETLHPVLLGYDRPTTPVKPEKPAPPKPTVGPTPYGVVDAFRPADPIAASAPTLAAMPGMRMTSDGPLPLAIAPTPPASLPEAEPGPAPREIDPKMPVIPFITVQPPVNPWAKVPPVQTLPRLGYFLVPPTGPGYYTGLDHIHGGLREKPPVNPYPPLALQSPSGFDADYRYLDDPKNTQHDFFDVLKRMHPTSDTMLSVGGQSDVRYMHEMDSRLGTKENEYTLYRNRVWADFWYTDSFRVYGEFIDALIAGNELPPLPIDENRGDILNLFVELKLGEFFGNSAYARLGRQEMLFGSQRLISTRDWANTRQTFEGARAYWRSGMIDFDVFCVRPVVIKPGDPDAHDEDAKFYGAWLTIRPGKGQFIDLYALGYQNDTYMPDPFVAAYLPGTQDVHTFGARYAGNSGPFLFDFEGMCQTGTVSKRTLKACAYTLATGYQFESKWQPQAWVSYDYASGTKDPLSADDRTFNQLFGFGHYYLGYMDFVGRQNIQDLSFQLAAYPEAWVTLVAQCHHFMLAESTDYLYNAAGKPTRRDPTGQAGRDVGKELDFTANFHLTPHQDVLIGYSRFFAGDFIKKTGPAVTPELFYLMYNFRW